MKMKTRRTTSTTTTFTTLTTTTMKINQKMSQKRRRRRREMVTKRFSWVVMVMSTIATTLFTFHPPSLLCSAYPSSGDYNYDRSSHPSSRRDTWNEGQGGQRQRQSQRQGKYKYDYDSPPIPPPPPPPPSRGVEDGHSQNKNKNSRPIHYAFPSVNKLRQEKLPDTAAALTNEEEDGADSIPLTGWQLDQDEERINNDKNNDNDNDSNEPIKRVPRDYNYDYDYASPRNDPVSRYLAQTSTTGKLKLTLSTFCIGSLLGAFFGKSIVDRPHPTSYVLGTLFLLAGIARSHTPYGEASQTLGLAGLLLLQRWKDVRSTYPTLPLVPRALGLAPRRPFPPNNNDNDNPWKYEPSSPKDVDFDMVKSALTIGLIGGYCGGTIDLPLVPNWMTGLAGVALAAYWVTAKSARGDLARMAAARVVALLGEALEVQSELGVGGKVARVGGRVLDLVLVLDRKHRVKERVGRGVAWVYERVSGKEGDGDGDVDRDGNRGRDRDGDRDGNVDRDGRDGRFRDTYRDEPRGRRYDDDKNIYNDDDNDDRRRDDGYRTDSDYERFRERDLRDKRKR